MIPLMSPSLNASPSGRTSLTKILLFLWLSMCPVTAKPRIKTDKESQTNAYRINQVWKSNTPLDRLTKVSAAARPADVQREHLNRDHLQLVADLQGDITQVNTHQLKRT